jgi:hypothetical protein
VREQPPRCMRSGIARAGAAFMLAIARVDVDSNPGVDAVVRAFDQIEKPGHIDKSVMRGIIADRADIARIASAPGNKP